MFGRPFTQAIDLGVSCCLEPEEETEMTMLCLRSTAYDIRQVGYRCFEGGGLLNCCLP